MAETPPKRKAKPKHADQSVLGTLPASRPERIGRPRRAAAVNGAAKKPAARKRAAPKPAAVPNGAATATRVNKPAAVRPASPPLQAAARGHGPPPKPMGAPTGTELVTTTIRAAGELAQIGFTVGGQVLKRTIDRIPRP